LILISAKKVRSDLGRVGEAPGSGLEVESMGGGRIGKGVIRELARGLEDGLGRVKGVARGGGEGIGISTGEISGGVPTITGVGVGGGTGF
jgi:hypothetical protein